MFAVRTARSLCCSIFADSMSSRRDGSEAVGLQLRLGLLDRLEEREERGEGSGGAGGVGFGGSDLLDAEMKCAEVAEAGDEGGVFGERKLQAEELM